MVLHFIIASLKLNKSLASFFTQH